MDSVAGSEDRQAMLPETLYDSTFTVAGSSRPPRTSSGFSTTTLAATISRSSSSPTFRGTVTVNCLVTVSSGCTMPAAATSVAVRVTSVSCGCGVTVACTVAESTAMAAGSEDSQVTAAFCVAVGSVKSSLAYDGTSRVSACAPSRSATPSAGRMPAISLCVIAPS